jgi:hypothetical protein
MALSAR